MYLHRTIVYRSRKEVRALEGSLLAEQLAVCRRAGIPPPARLRKAVRQLHWQALCGPAASIHCDVSECLEQLAALLREVCPMPPQSICTNAPAGLYANAAPGELGRFLLQLIGCLFPLSGGTPLHLSAQQCGGRVLVCLQQMRPLRKQKPPRSLTRQARCWARKRGGLFFYGCSGSGFCCVLALLPGQAVRSRPPRYALWAFDRFSPVYSLLPGRLILPH